MRKLRQAKVRSYPVNLPKLALRRRRVMTPNPLAPLSNADPGYGHHPGPPFREPTSCTFYTTSQAMRLRSTKQYGKQPQGELKMLTANAGGAQDAITYLCTLKVDAIMIQEHKLDQISFQSAAKACFAAGWAWRLGPGTVQQHPSSWV